MLTPDLARRFARIALGHVTREYPHKLDHVMTGPDDVAPPRLLHPIYYGSFDWHSCVHGYWTLATVLRIYPDIPEAQAIRTRLDAAFTPDAVAGEVGYLARPSARGFERPYGWGWLLALQAELTRHNTTWAEIHQPLADAFVARFHAFLPLAEHPIRTGVHSSAAFAITLAADYARTVGDPALASRLAAKARAWHLSDRDAPALEPSGEDFLSPTLVTAVCLQRALPPEEWRDWFEAYLPDAARGRPATLFTPVVSTDRTDGKLAHLDGLNLSRAWAWRELASALPENHPARPAIRAAAEAHLAAGLPHVAGDYMGEHWLATFALMALIA